VEKRNEEDRVLQQGECEMVTRGLSEVYKKRSRSKRRERDRRKGVYPRYSATERDPLELYPEERKRALTYYQGNQRHGGGGGGVGPSGRRFPRCSGGREGYVGALRSYGFISGRGRRQKGGKGGRVGIGGKYLIAVKRKGKRTIPAVECTTLSLDSLQLHWEKISGRGNRRKCL